MSKLHFIGGEKGGVGKSLTARVLAQFLIDHKSPFIGFDSDESQSTFSRFYGEFASDVRVEDYESLDKLIEFADQRPDHDLIVDLAARTHKAIYQWIEDSDAIELLSGLGVHTYVWHVMDGGADSVALLDRALSDYEGQAVKFIIVQNKGRGEDFSGFASSAVYHRALQRGADFIVLPKLQPAIVQQIDFKNLSFWAAAHNNHGLSLVERQRVKVWLDKIYMQFEPLIRPVRNDLISDITKETL